MKTPSQIDWARLATWIDGEGTIRLATLSARAGTGTGHRSNYYPDVRVTGTDPRLASWLQETFGQKVYWNKRQSTKWKSAFHWVVSCRQACAVLRECLPYLILKKQQAEIVLAFQATRTRRYGVSGLPKEIWAKRDELAKEIHELNRRSPKGESQELIQ